MSVLRSSLGEGNSVVRFFKMGLLPLTAIVPVFWSFRRCRESSSVNRKSAGFELLKTQHDFFVGLVLAPCLIESGKKSGADGWSL